MLNKIRKWRHIDSAIGDSGWEELLERTLESIDAFHALIQLIPSSADRIKGPRTMMLRDMLAHIIDMNFATGTIIDALRMNKTLTYNMDTFYAGAGKRTWEELISEHEESRDWIQETGEEPVSSLRKNPHHLYGEISSRDWLGLTIRHYQYHTLQVKKIMESEKYRTSIQKASETRNSDS